MSTKKHLVSKGTWIELPSKMPQKKVDQKIEEFKRKHQEANNSINGIKY